MQTFYQFLPFIIIVIAFVVFGTKLKKFRNMLPQDLSGMMSGGVTPKYENNMPNLAEALGLTYKEVKNEGTDSATFMNSGSEMHGIYRGHKVEIVMKVTARHANIMRTGSYAYAMDKYISIALNKEAKGAFHIQAKNSNIASEATGLANFDAKMIITGDANVSKEYLEYFAKFGWMNLKLEKNQLLFQDTFYEELAQSGDASSMMVARHPVWGSTAQNPAVNIDTVKEFIDKLIDLADVV